MYDTSLDICTPATALYVEGGRVLCRQGEIGREFFVIIEGEVSVTADGHEIAVLGPGQFFGELSLLDLAPRNATVRALTPLEVLVLNRAEFATLFDGSPSAARRILQAVPSRLRSRGGHRPDLRARRGAA